MTATTATHGPTTDYNYDHFRARNYDFVTVPGPHVGQPMPDLQFTTLEGVPASLTQYRGRRVVLETGSITCPMYAKGVPTMQELVARHSDVVFLLLYVREAHPGERLGPHRTFEQKLGAARRLPGLYHDDRVVVVDDVEGTAHRALGALPNMVYIVDPDGTVAYRATWTNTDLVADVLDGSAASNVVTREVVAPSKPAPWVAVRVLLVGGWRALAEFVVGLPRLLLMHRRADRHPG